MKNTLLFAFLLLALAACKKHTEFSGTVFSSADGKPVAGARVRLYFYYGAGGGQTKILAEDEMTTDETGKYFVSCDVNKYDGGALRVFKDESFERFSKPVDAGDCVALDITIHPIDAWLGFSVENTRDTTIQCYSSYYGDFFESSGHCINGCGPFEIAPHTTKLIGIRSIPGGQEIRVFWDDQKYKEAKFAKNMTPVFCPRNDTTVVKVVF